MTNKTRAGINILGATGEIFDISSMGSREITSHRESKGVYIVKGTYGMVPFPPVNVGWGYALNNVDRKADVELEYDESTQLLKVITTKNDQPYDLIHMITLHVLVDEIEYTE